MCCSIEKKRKKKKIKLDNRHLIIIRYELINQKPKNDLGEFDWRMELIDDLHRMNFSLPWMFDECMNVSNELRSLKHR